jgi:hypothetical protein
LRAQIEVDVCPSSLSHGSIAKCAIGAISSTERVAHLRLNAVCVAVREAAEKACSSSLV